MLVPFYGCSYGFLEAIPSYCQCCVCGGYVLGEEVRGGFYADGFAWSGEGWGTSWGMGAFCVPAVGGWVLVFSIAVIAPHEHSTHEHPTKWSTHNPLKPKTTRGGTIMCHPQPSTQTGEPSLTCNLCTTTPATQHRTFKKVTLTLCQSCNEALETISHEENCTIPDAYKIAKKRIYQHILEPVGLTPKRVKRLTQK